MPNTDHLTQADLDSALPGTPGFGGAVRATLILVAFFAMTLPLMPLQWLFVAMAPRAARVFPHIYHRWVCRLIGIRLNVDGEIPHDTPVLLVSNHVSWVDIPVLSAVAPLSFIAKREVGGWPFVSWLAKLQRTIFIDRTKRSDIPKVAANMRARLRKGEALVLFAEGTSSDGNRVLPFKSSLLAIAIARGPGGINPEAAEDIRADAAIQLQTITLVYTHVHGIPLGRADRVRIGWYGDMEMGGHAWELLKAGPIDVTISVGPPVDLDGFEDRKDLARHTENQIRQTVSDILRSRQPHGHDPA